MTTCSTKNCYAEKSIIDTIFCFDCRREWRRFCTDNGLIVPVTDTKIQPYLKRFQKRFVNDGEDKRGCRCEGNAKSIFGNELQEKSKKQWGGETLGSFSRYFDLDKWFINKLPKEVRKTFPFLIVPKASGGEKNEGCNNFEKDKKTIEHRFGRYRCKTCGKLKLDYNPCKCDNPQFERIEPNKGNIHPTVKPVKLMSYLITLGSRQNDLILDPFMGSGTTAIASRLLTRNFIGFELNKEYHKIAEARIKDYMEQRKICEVG